MKKILIVLVMALLLVGCGNKKIDEKKDIEVIETKDNNEEKEIKKEAEIIEKEEKETEKEMEIIEKEVLEPDKIPAGVIHANTIYGKIEKDFTGLYDKREVARLIAAYEYDNSSDLFLDTSMGIKIPNLNIKLINYEEKITNSDLSSESEDNYFYNELVKMGYTYKEIWNLSKSQFNILKKQIGLSQASQDWLVKYAKEDGIDNEVANNWTYNILEEYVKSKNPLENISEKEYLKIKDKGITKSDLKDLLNRMEEEKVDAILEYSDEDLKNILENIYQEKMDELNLYERKIKWIDKNTNKEKSKKYVMEYSADNALLKDNEGNVIFQAKEFGLNRYLILDDVDIMPYVYIIDNGNKKVVFEIETSKWLGNYKNIVFENRLDKIIEQDKYVVYENNMAGLINEKGELILEPSKYELTDIYINTYKNVVSLIKVFKNGRTGFLDKDMNLIVEPEYEYVFMENIEDSSEKDKIRMYFFKDEKWIVKEYDKKTNEIGKELQGIKVPEYVEELAISQGI